MICKRCPGAKPQSAFNRSSNYASGFSKVCRECNSKQQKVSKDKKKAEHYCWNEYHRNYYHANREKIRARQAEYYRSKRA